MTLIIYVLSICTNIFGPMMAYADTELVEYSGPIEHIFTHCLIADHTVAFDKNNEMRDNYNIDCITKEEFSKLLDQLYGNNFVLIDICSIFTVKDNIAVKQKLYLPKGKKPLIISFDDVNYDHKKSNLGMVDKIVLDANNNLATIINTPTYNNRISYNNEFVVILEDFISNHPDFSYNNARGVICLTGYDGILGYRTQSKNPNRQSEIEQAKKVVEVLTDKGWRFASHSYGHYHMKKISTEHFREELELWDKEVSSIVGATPIYVYPYGEWDVYDSNGNLTPKHKLLQDYGFKLFCGVGIKPYFEYLRGPRYDKVLFMDRTPIDGRTLYYKQDKLSRLVVASQIYDYKNRPKQK